MLKWSKFRLWLSVLLALASLTAVSIAAVSPDHFHAGLNPDACSVCNASHLPAIFSIAPAEVWPPAMLAEKPRTAISAELQAIESSSTGSRAPPVNSAA